MMLDLRIDDARAYTMDEARPRATRIGVLHGRIVALDDECDGADARQIIDARGRTLLPGFVDAHNHLAWAGHAAGSLDLSPADSVDAALALIADAAARTPEGGWVDVVGYDQRALGRHLRSDDLDKVSAGRRVYVIHTSGHGHLVNSAVLAEVPADLDATADPGVIRDEDGRPTGLFLEEATRFVNAIRTPYGIGELVDALAAASDSCAAQGITAVAEAGVGAGLTTRSPIEVRAWQDAVDSGRFTLRAQLLMSLDLIGETHAHPADGVAAAFPTGLRTGFGSDRLSIGATKTWLDGGMMARTAALSEPYRDGSGASGALAADLDDLRRRAIAAHAGGWQLALHAIGDAAIDAALDIVETAQAERPRADARHRIEHCGLARPDQLPRLAAAAVVVVTQPTFLYAWGDDYASIMGPDRADWLYRGQSYLDAGITVAGSSDRPVADGAPLRAMQFLVDRTTRTGTTVGAHEAMDVTDAVRAYTRGAAYACHAEQRIGSIAVGKAADFVLLGADPWQVDPAELADIPVLATVVGGELVYGGWDE